MAGKMQARAAASIFSFFFFLLFLFVVYFSLVSLSRLTVRRRKEETMRLPFRVPSNPKHSFEKPLPFRLVHCLLTCKQNIICHKLMARFRKILNVWVATKSCSFLGHVPIWIHRSLLPPVGAPCRNTSKVILETSAFGKSSFWKPPCRVIFLTAHWRVDLAQW